MTQANKDLLLKDICSRLPYGVKVEYENEIFDVEHVCPMYEEVKLDILEAWTIGVSEVKPYLFPLSSMTDEQIYQSPFGYATMDTIRQDDSWSTITIGCREYDDIIDWLNKNHFDYRGLIPMGLALDATGLNIY